MQEKHSKKRLVLICKQCSATFEVYPCERDQKYCSKNCANSAALRYPTVARTCPRCGTHFTALDKGEKTRKYCRKGCGPTKDFICVICGDLFTLPFYRWNDGRGTCCSRKCTTVLVKRARIESDVAKRIQKSCHHCTARFWLAPLAAARSGKPFCSKACRVAYSESRIIDRFCEWCGKAFRRPVSQIEAAGGDRRCRFCSKSCAGAYAIRHCQHRVSALESHFFDLLEARGVAVKRQSKVARYNVDGLLVDKKIIIEFDGVYWHSQPATATLDAKKDHVFQEQGYRLIRVQDTDFKKNPTRTILRVLKQLSSSQATLFAV